METLQKDSVESFQALDVQEERTRAVLGED